MATTFIYLFLFTTWGLGLLSWVAWLGHKFAEWETEAQDKELEIEQKRVFLDKLSAMTKLPSPMSSSPTISKEIPEKIKKLMESSPEHPEVDEIDGSDEIIGIKFQAENYPPGFVDDED